MVATREFFKGRDGEIVRFDEKEKKNSDRERIRFRLLE